MVVIFCAFLREQCHYCGWLDVQDVVTLRPFMDADCTIWVSILAILCAALPPPQTKEARPVLEMRLRSSRVEGAVSGVWGVSGVRKQRLSLLAGWRF